MAELATHKVRIIDIAQRVGVSKATVARVLNHAGKNTIRVSDARKQEILEMARKMHYVPNHAAQTLAGKSTMKLGVLIDSRAPWCIYRTLCAFEDAAVAAGYRLMVGRAHDNPSSLMECYDNFIQHGIDGVACLAHDYPQHPDVLRNVFRGVPGLVFYDPPSWDAPHVFIDRTSGLTQAIRHLQSTGRSRIGLWLPLYQPYFSFRQRIEAYEACCDEPVLMTDNTVEEAVKTVRQNHLDAVLCSNDSYAAQLIRALALLNLRIPDDIAIVGHDNEEFSSFFLPSITTIDQHDEEVGRQLFALLNEQLQNHSTREQAIVESQLIIRESTPKHKEMTPWNIISNASPSSNSSLSSPSSPS